MMTPLKWPRQRAFGLVSMFFACLCTGSAVAQETADPQEPPVYVGSQNCTSCHGDVSAKWAGSHHALAWTEPGPDTVKGDFDDAEFAHDGTLTKFETREEGYFITVTEKDGVTTEYKVHSVAGIEPLQQYLLETEPGRLQSFDVVWDTERGVWYHLYPDQDLPPDDGLHWTGPYKTWNARCAECHATGYRRNYGMRTRSYSSQMSEIGVGCEACHGPGSAHVAWAQTRSPVKLTGLDAFGFSGPTGGEAMEQCAGCHSRREDYGNGNPVPGTPFADAYGLAVLRPGLYHADGQILDEVYVYGSFLQSRMYAKGVTCLNCHDPHAADVKAEGNAVCTQCHSSAGNADFPSLRLAEYDSADHHFHEPGSDGAQCRSCHMIERTYMGIDGRRDHSFRVPRPDLAGQTGGPDACTDCHAGKTPEWAASEIAQRYPDGRHTQGHYGQVLAAGRADPAAASGDLVALAMDPDAAPIVRATALYLVQAAQDPAIGDATAPALSDEDPVVRSAAAQVQSQTPPDTRLERLTPLLSDPNRAVRIAAARAFVGMPPDSVSPSQAALLREAMQEWQRALADKFDFPETHAALGGLALTQRNLQAASAAFSEAVRLDPQNLDAWIMLIRIAAAQGGAAEARPVLNEALQRMPEAPVLLKMQEELR